MAEDMREFMIAAGLPEWAAEHVITRLGIHDRQQLITSIESGLFRAILGNRSNIDDHVMRFSRMEDAPPPVPAFYAGWRANRLLRVITRTPGVKRVEIAGELRRGCEVVSRADILVCTERPARLLEELQGFCGDRDVVSHLTMPPGIADSSRQVETCGAGSWIVNLHAGNLPIRISLTCSRHFGGMLQFLTGAPGHNRLLARLAEGRGFRLVRGLLMDSRTGVEVEIADERDLYTKLGLPFIPPELREGKNEIEVALNGLLPALLEPQDLAGDLHTHTNWSDGLESIEDMVMMGARMGYAYMAISDHSAFHASANGLSVERLLRQWESIGQVQRSHPEIAILRGIEVDILPDGRLDLPDELLANADIVLASIHERAGQGKHELTGRIIRAMSNPHVDIIAHPTGRKIGEDDYGVDTMALLQAAQRTGTALEINCAPDRFDIDDRLVRRCRSMGVMMSIGSDSHSTGEMSLVSMGIRVARRGWCEKKDILNAMDLPALREWLRNHKLPERVRATTGP
ncbi:MAG TPA: PHP domain-containing protein [Firmicutes bacterium]|nr:PHP domain-containing protein [Bacillota bacterium]